MTLLDPRTWLAALAALTIATGLGYWRGHTAGTAAVQARWDADTTREQLASAQAALQAEQVNRQREKELRSAAESNARQTEIALADARRERAAADAVGKRLRQQVAELVAASKRAAGTAAGPAASGTPVAGGATAIDLLAELHARTDAAAGELAAVADDARVRGQACERAYDAVIGVDEQSSNAPRKQ